jgi:hypothetical protein
LTQTRRSVELKAKTVAVDVFITVAILGLVTPTLPVMAQIGSQIEQVFPTSLVGTVGGLVNIIGSIDTANGKYEIYFGTILVATQTAQGSAVNVGFLIPETSGGTYTITLRDVTTNSNATKDFTVNTAYSLSPSVPTAPALLQEGSSVVLNVTITGGQANTAYKANITVIVPAPLSTNYSRLVSLPTSSSKGTTTMQVTYPDSAFEPSGSISDYAGTYNVYFNQSLASSQFTIGFTDMSQYHRGQTVKIRAIGYQSNDTATVTIKNEDSGASMFSADVTPTSAGIVTAEWTVPSNAAIGNYDVSITARNMTKAVPDSEVISVPGYAIKIRVLDLSNRAVPQILVEAVDTATNKTYDGTSGDDGIAAINLESGRHFLTAFWNGLEVGGTSINVTGAAQFDLQCQLTDLKITVIDRNGLLIPSVSLDISYVYTSTKDDQQKTGSVAGQTDLSGTYTLNSTPPGITYTIKASVYGVTFNSGNDTVSNLPVKPVNEVTIICPGRTLTFTVTDYNHNPISNARLSLLEATAGIFYGATTSDNGSVMVEATFGKYRTRVYTGSVLLNETVIEAFTDKQVDIQCVLYNLQVNVQVVDFFGQAIPNANVKFTGADGAVQTGKTQADGTAVFNRVVGGDVQIVAYLNEGDSYYEARNLNVESPITVQIRMGRYIAFGTVIIQTSTFITAIVILVVVVLFLILEVVRRRKTKPKKVSATVEKPSAK